MDNLLITTEHFQSVEEPTLECEDKESFVQNLGTLSPTGSMSSFSMDTLSVNPSDSASLVPTVDGTLKCSTHKLEFQDYEQQIFHNVLHHQGRLICNICGKSYVQKNNLEDHVQTHYGNFYHCQQQGCDKKFATLRGLEIHNVKHAGSSFVCSFCNKKCALKEKLEVHTNTHLTRKWQCELCGKKLGRRSDMQKHINENCLKRSINLMSASESEADVSANGSTCSLRSRNSDLEIVNGKGPSSNQAKKRPAAEATSSNGVVMKKEK